MARRTRHSIEYSAKMDRRDNCWASCVAGILAVEQISWTKFFICSSFNIFVLVLDEDEDEEEEGTEESTVGDGDGERWRFFDVVEEAEEEEDWFDFDQVIVDANGGSVVVEDLEDTCGTIDFY